MVEVPRSVPFQDGMKVGFGYDCIQGSPLASPAVVGPISSIQDAGGQTVQSHLVRIDDVQTMHEAFGINVDAGGSYFGASASAKVNFVQECNVQTHSTHVLTGVSVQDAFENFDAPVLSPDAENLLRNQNQQRFHDRFGDVFIGGLLRGGEYFAVFEINCVDQDTRDAIAGHVEASFNSLVARASLQVDIESEKKKTNFHAEVRVHVWQKGAINHTDQSMEEILQKAHDFPPSVAGDKAAAYAVSLVDYKTLKLPVDDFNFLDIENQRDVLAEHAQKRFALLERRNTINYIREHSEDFVNPDPGKLADESVKITDAISTMEREASACLRDAKTCNFTPFDVADFPVPDAKQGKLTIPVVSLVGLRAWAINKALSEPHTEYEQFKAEVLAELEPGSEGVLPSLDQFNFILSGIKITYDKPQVSKSSGFVALHARIVAQEPASGNAATGTSVLLNVLFP